MISIINCFFLGVLCANPLSNKTNQVIIFQTTEGRFHCTNSQADVLTQETNFIFKGNPAVFHCLNKIYSKEGDLSVVHFLNHIMRRPRIGWNENNARETIAIWTKIEADMSNTFPLKMAFINETIADDVVNRFLAPMNTNILPKDSDPMSELVIVAALPASGKSDLATHDSRLRSKREFCNDEPATMLPFHTNSFREIVELKSQDYAKGMVYDYIVNQLYHTPISKRIRFRLIDEASRRNILSRFYHSSIFSDGNMETINYTIQRALEQNLRIRLIGLLINEETRVARLKNREKKEIESKEMKGGCLSKNLANRERHLRDFAKNLVKTVLEFKHDARFRYVIKN